MKNLPENWRLVEEYDGNKIFETKNEKFQVSVDDMGRLVPRYSICFQQLKGTSTKISFENGAYATHAFNEFEAKEKAYEMMEFINYRISVQQ